jgi:hypothetical protein
LPGVLGGWFLVIEPPRGAKDAKVGFMELNRLCGYKALS